ncbi:MAG: hypothetical protein ACRDPQ_09045 [Nocardioidaceae bacterium]
MIVGTGSIGREIARLLRAVGITVHGVGRTPSSRGPRLRGRVGVVRAGRGRRRR